MSKFNLFKKKYKIYPRYSKSQFNIYPDRFDDEEVLLLKRLGNTSSVFVKLKLKCLLSVVSKFELTKQREYVIISLTDSGSCQINNGSIDLEPCQTFKTTVDQEKALNVICNSNSIKELSEYLDEDGSINKKVKTKFMDDNIRTNQHENSEGIFIDEGVNKKIKSQPSNPTIQTLHENYKDGDLVISPDFQRNYVWDNKKASNLIESILLNIPLPIVFTAEAGDKEEVIDGQQRLTSIFSFLDGRYPDGSKFKLSRNLRVLSKEVGGKSFAELDKKYQKIIKKYSLFMVSISEDSQEDVKFEMFERLNTNITKLNSQELRNCLYRGHYNDFLKKMAEYEDFQFVLNKPSYGKRMQDVELVLMFCAFHNKNPIHYKKSLSQMLNYEMNTSKFISNEQLMELEKQFKKSIQLIKQIWGTSAFNMCSVDESTKSIAVSNTFNQGLFQILTYWFIPYEKHQVAPYSDLIREEMTSLQIHDQVFRSTLTGSGTNSPKNIRLKFDIWGNTLKGILDYPQNEPRAFSYALKEKLFNDSDICKICGQKISVIEDAEIDHIICYWKGGKTVPENARLTHRYCNRSRGGGEDIKN